MLYFRNYYSFAFNYPCPRKLREIMKMSMIERQPVKTIENIWQDYHRDRVNNIAKVLTKQKFEHLQNKAHQSPLFIIPVLRKGGHFKLLTQWQDKCFLGTYLQDYKRKGPNTPPYIVYTLFTELLFNKGIVLVRGDIINNSLTKPEAQRVWELIEQSYVQEDKYEMVNSFNNSTHQFSEERYNKTFGLL